MNRVEVYDPVTDQWTKKAGMAISRTDFGAAEVNGKIYVVGGWSKSIIIGTVEEFDPVKNKWINKKSTTPRSLHSAASSNGKVYLIGGTKDYSNAIQFVDAYNPALDQ